MREELSIPDWNHGPSLSKVPCLRKEVEKTKLQGTYKRIKKNIGISHAWYILHLPPGFHLCSEFAGTMDPGSPTSLFHPMQGTFSWTIAKPQPGFDTALLCKHFHFHLACWAAYHHAPRSKLSSRTFFSPHIHCLNINRYSLTFCMLFTNHSAFTICSN